MPVRIRLQRHGKKNQPIYHIVVADGRAPRDGKFIEKLGVYNPMTNPATVTFDIDKAVQWMRNGAQPSDTVKSIFSHKGAMLKHHLLRGVDKGALTAEQAEAKFQAWIAEKENKLAKAHSDRQQKRRDDHKVRMEAEIKVKEAKAAQIQEKRIAATVAQTPAQEEVAAETEATPDVEKTEE